MRPHRGTAGRERYPALTGIRAFGAIAIFFDHFPPWANWHIIINVMAFFYVLSGFLIVRLYHEQARLTGEWLSKYFINRFARIYPVYFLLLTVAVCLQRDFSPGVLLSNYTLTHALFHPSRLIIQPSWSLTVEECFYGLAPLFMVLARRSGFAAAFTLAAALLGAALFVSTLDIRFLHTPAFVLSTTFFGHFAEFFAGVYLALYVTRLENSGSLRVSGRWRTVAGLAGVSALTLAMLIIYRRPPLDDAAIVLINNFLMPAPIALLYCGLIREDTALSRALSGRFAGLLGRSSYSFYLLHMLVIDYLSVPLLSAMPHGRPAVVLGTLIVTWTLAIALFSGFEEPVNLAIRRRLKSKSSPVALAATAAATPAGPYAAPARIRGKC
ncbi:MAG: acyltransferase [Gammaproteobacteria bacterium]|nr:acyltransferase [Gammaproteobacteria bacterium]